MYVCLHQKSIQILQYTCMPVNINVIMNLMHLASEISRSCHANGLLIDIDDSYTSCKYILDDMVLIRSKPRKVDHDLDLKIAFMLS